MPCHKNAVPPRLFRLYRRGPPLCWRRSCWRLTCPPHACPACMPYCCVSVRTLRHGCDSAAGAAHSRAAGALLAPCSLPLASRCSDPSAPHANFRLRAVAFCLQKLQVMPRWQRRQRLCLWQRRGGGRSASCHSCWAAMTWRPSTCCCSWWEGARQLHQPPLSSAPWVLGSVVHSAVGAALQALPCTLGRLSPGP
jgi:hypothetical protein